MAGFQFELLARELPGIPEELVADPDSFVGPADRIESGLSR